MESSSSSDINKKKHVFFMCPVCHDNLQKYSLTEENIVNLSCGHVYHQSCWQDWSKERNVGKEDGQPWEYECIMCKRVSSSDSAKQLFLDAHVDQAYLEVTNSNKRLRLDNHVLKQQLDEAEIKLLVMKQKTEQLRLKLENFKWRDLTQSFKDELVSKLLSTCSSLQIENTDLWFLRSTTIFELIRCDSDENSIIQKFSEDLYEYHSSSNETITLDNYKQFFDFDILACLRKASDIPSLDLLQFPVSAKIIQKLLSTKKEELTKDRGIVLKLLEIFVCVDFGRYVRQLLGITLVDLITKQINFDFYIPVPSVNKSLLSFFVIKKILKLHDGVYSFCHDSVRLFLLGLLIAIVRKKVDLSLLDACLYISEGRSDCHSLHDYCIDSLSNIKGFVTDTLKLYFGKIMKSFTDEYHMDLFVVLAIMKIKRVRILSEILCKFKRCYDLVGRSIWDIKVPCKVDSCPIELILPEFAAIRGNSDIMKYVHDFNCSKNVNDYFKVRTLVQLCAHFTLNQTDQEIDERRKTISYILSFDACREQMIFHKSKATCITVNLSLLKTVLEKGLNIFLHMWDAKHILGIVMPHLNKEDSVSMAFALIEPSKMMELLDLYDHYRPITI